jgi:hypothetical protein
MSQFLGKSSRRHMEGMGNNASRIPNLDTKWKLLTRLTYLIDVFKHLLMNVLD